MVLREKPAVAPDSAPATPVEDDDALRKRLLSRVAVAGVAIVGLLGGLAVYDSMNRPQPPAMPPMAAVSSEPAAEQKKEVLDESSTTTDKQAEGELNPLASQDGDNDTAVETEKEVTEKGETVAANQNGKAVNRTGSGPLADAPPKLATTAESARAAGPTRLAKPLTAPATARGVTAKQGAAAVAPLRPDPQRELASAVPEETAAAYAPLSRQATNEGTAGKASSAGSAAKHAPASRPLSRVAETTKRFLVQIGVFSNHTNAEELVNRLHQAGIPAQIESRVQVGPFASRLEVDAARAKLKTMGLDEGLLVRR